MTSPINPSTTHSIQVKIFSSLVNFKKMISNFSNSLIGAKNSHYSPTGPVVHQNKNYSQSENYNNCELISSRIIDSITDQKIENIKDFYKNLSGKITTSNSGNILDDFIEKREQNSSPMIQYHDENTSNNILKKIKNHIKKPFNRIINRNGKYNI